VAFQYSNLASPLQKHLFKAQKPPPPRIRPEPQRRKPKLGNGENICRYTPNLLLHPEKDKKKSLLQPKKVEKIPLLQSEKDEKNITPSPLKSRQSPKRERNLLRNKSTTNH
jgi:hypothetical protein